MTFVWYHFSLDMKNFSPQFDLTEERTSCLRLPFMGGRNWKMAAPCFGRWEASGMVSLLCSPWFVLIVSFRYRYPKWTGTVSRQCHRHNWMPLMCFSASVLGALTLDHWFIIFNRYRVTLFNELYYLVAGGTVWTGKLVAMNYVP